MPIIILPDGSSREFKKAVTVYEVAENIGAGLARATIAGKLDGMLVDSSYVIKNDAKLSIITANSPEGLEIIRHSSAHLLAQAVKELYPETQVTIGPVVENGFYYDFAREDKFTLQDLDIIQNKMQELSKDNLKVERLILSREQAIDFFRDQGEKYKAKIIQDIPENEILSLYKQGDFVDLCRGPHVPSTVFLKDKFKLTKLAGAYWRGDSNNEMLQRIYGTAWSSKKELKQCLHQLSEAEKRDHRKLGKQLDLFHTQEEAPGMVFWHDKGWTIYRVVVEYIRQVVLDEGYKEVKTPQVLDRSLWEQSGHWEKFGDMMFTTHSENRDYAVKPMNCPGHIQIYKNSLKSYRDLPLRFAEFGSCHRNEPSGTLHGLMRARNFVQDDGHIFCTEEQIQSEVSGFIDTLFKVYVDFGFEQVLTKLSTRPEQRVGNDKVWDKAEVALTDALNAKELNWDLQEGEGAFYGPKIEFSLKDSIGRIWQCGTIQVDFSMPGRLNAEYVTEDSDRQTPVMLHRAILGSIERFVGILIEDYAGAMPAWLAPVQAVIANISENQKQYCKKIAKILKKSGFRVQMDLRNEKVGFKIREHSLAKVPYILVVGDREMENSEVAVRGYGNQDLGAMPIDDFIKELQTAVAKLGRKP